MNITFLIGNGFDIGIGMKTRFKDMYKDYIDTRSNSQHIREFKIALREDAPLYENWGDFEMGMAKYAQTFKDENAFVDCIRDFKAFMVQYLQQEQNIMLDRIKNKEKYEEVCAVDIHRAISDFYKGQNRNVIVEMEEMFASEGFCRYSFITFNYTMVLDFMLSCYRRRFKTSMEGPVHIHGKIDEDVVLGIDNEMQLQGLSFPISKKVQRAFIKPLFNNMYDKYRVNIAMNMIDKSDVICVYGMSLGESDRTWINKLIEWIKADRWHYLFYYDYANESYDTWNRDLMMDMEDEKRERFINKIMGTIGEVEQISEQVHIPIAHDIFNIKNVLPNI